MKKLVEIVNVRKSKINYKEIVLKTILMTTVVSVAVMAPNALQMFGYLKKKDRHQTNFRIRSHTDQFIKSGHIKMTTGGLSLTDKGQAELLKFSDVGFRKRKKWDGLWTIVSFDFPVAKNKIRDAVRFYLKRIGFIQLQKSVWVFPYDCPELIYLVKTEWKLTDELVYIRAKYVSREKKLKEYFDL